MSRPIRNSNWHESEKQPCISCRKWMHIEVAIHFLGSGYECDHCYQKRHGKRPTHIDKKDSKEELICSNCGWPDHSEHYDTITRKHVSYPIQMYLTSDRKLVCHRCVREAELDRWWQEEMAKPRRPHPSYYLKHDPLSKICTCEFCSNGNGRKGKATYNSNIPDSQRTAWKKARNKLQHN
jgi:hypothetical protein